MNYNFLNESIITEDLTLSLGSVFHKIDIYSRNRNLAILNESQYGKYNKNIHLSLNEQKSVKQMFLMMEAAAAESIINEYNLDLDYYSLNEGWSDKIKSKIDKFSDKAKNGIDKLSSKSKEGIEKLQALKEFFEVLIKKAVDSIEKFLKLLLEIFAKLGENIQEGVKKLLGNSLKVKTDLSLPQNEITKEFPEEDHGFLALVYDYLYKRMTKDPSSTRMMKSMSEKTGVLESLSFPKQNWPELNEGFKEGFDKFVHTNKTFQWLIGYRPGNGKVKWWKSLIASIIGSIIFTLIIPALLTVCLGSGPIVAGICFAIQITWATKGVCRVLLARYTSKGPGEKFWNRQTAIAFCIAVAFMIIPRIPAVREWMAEGIRDFLHWTGLDKKIADVEDWLRGVMGWVKTEKNVVTRYEKLSDRLERYVPRNGKGDIAREMQGLSSKTSDAIDTIKNSTTIPKDMKGPLERFTNLINQQHFSSSHEMNQFMIGGLKDAKKAVYSFDMSRFKTAAGYAGKSTREIAMMVKQKLEEKGINGTVINALNDEMRSSTHNIAGANAMFVTDIPVEQGPDFEQVFQEIAKEAGIKGGARGAFGHLLNDLNQTIAVDEITEKPIHTFTDFIANNFIPMFFPKFSHSGEWCAIYNNDPNRYPIVKREEMSYEELDSLTPRSDGESWNVVARKIRSARRKELAERVNAAKEAKKAGELSGEEWKTTVTELKREIEVYNNFKPADCKVLVFFTTGKFKIKTSEKKHISESLYNKYNLFEDEMSTWNKDTDNDSDHDDTLYFDDEESATSEETKYKEVELKDAPLFAWNPYILYHADLQEITLKNTGTEKTNWLMRGLFKAHMRIEPLKPKDPKKPYENSVGREIKKKINTVFDSMIKTSANAFGMDKIAYLDGKTFKPVDESKAEKNIKLMGNFKPVELCRIWNKEEPAWKYLWIEDETTDEIIPDNIKPTERNLPAVVKPQTKDVVPVSNKSKDLVAPHKKNKTLYPDEITNDTRKRIDPSRQLKSRKYDQDAEYEDLPDKEDQKLLAPHKNKENQKLLAPHKKKQLLLAQHNKK